MRRMPPTLRVEPSPTRRSATGRADWALAALVVATSLTELFLRTDTLAWPLGLGVGVLLASTMLWRRTHPLGMVMIAFVTIAVADAISVLLEGGSFFLYSGGFLLVLVFALTRWGNTLHMIIGMCVVMLGWALSVILEPSGFEDAVGGVLLLLFTAALGLIVRYRAIVVAQRLDHIRSTERENLARELHDTVAHRVSAITIQAQAGRWLASSNDVDGAAEALRTIEGEAALAMTEMRSMVGALRRDGTTPATLVPRGLDGIDDLAASGAASAGPQVEVERRGNLDDLPATVAATLYRVAQESITNARSHAHRPTRIHILLEECGEDVLVSVTNDGERITGGMNPAGYGLLGMAERVELLGGTLEAGPGRDGGWHVKARIPRKGGAP